jgi:pimeloyl-ACP methyl ester carboxylesterase
MGQGKPTVVVAGAGFSFDWGLVQPEAAKFIRICTYDPSGTAWSDPGPGLSCAGRVDEIHAVIQNAKLEGPYVLVGLSVGALVSRVYATLYPSDVAGIVLVDHAFLDVGNDPPAQASPPTSGLDSPPVLVYKVPIDLTVEDSSDFDKLPERAQRLHRWAGSLKPQLPTVETAEECLAMLKLGGQKPRELGDKPVVVVSTGNDLPNYKKLQLELLSLSSRSKQLIADGSFHSVEIDQPDVVVEAIRQAVEMVRQSKEPR